jgi:hypothetical protein
MNDTEESVTQIRHARGAADKVVAAWVDGAQLVVRDRLPIVATT